MKRLIDKDQVLYFLPVAALFFMLGISIICVLNQDLVLFQVYSPLMWIGLSLIPVAVFGVSFRAILKKNDSLEQLVLSLKDKNDRLSNDLEMVQASAGVGMWNLYLDKEAVCFSPEMKRIHGIESEENLFTKEYLFNHHVYPDDQKMILEQFFNWPIKRVYSEFIFRIYRTDGRVRWLKISKPLIRKYREDGSPKVLAGTVQDITTIKHVEDSLQESEIRYRRIVEMSPNMVLIHREGRILYINNAGCALLGASNKSMILGKNIQDFIVPENHKQIKKRVKHLQQAGGISHLYEQKIKGIKGEVVDIDLCGVEFIYEGGSAIQVIARDITEHKKADDRLQKLNEELESRIEERTCELVLEMENKKQLQSRLIISERLAATGLLASSIAHEINSPLQGIISLLEFMEKSNPGDEALHENLDLLRMAFGSIRTTVTKLLDLNRPLKEPKQIDNVNNIVEKTVSILRSHLNKNNVLVELDLSLDIPKLYVSSQQLSHCFLNIINNSVEAFLEQVINPMQTLGDIPPGGTISFKTYVSRGMVVMSISDDGPGVPSEDLEHIFDAFYTNKCGKGMGMGLTVCLEIMENHGGKIYAGNNDCGGAVLTMEFPVKAPPGGPDFKNLDK